jgi:hypothetical protein
MKESLQLQINTSEKFKLIAINYIILNSKRKKNKLNKIFNKKKLFPKTIKAK